jgi:hypothetical protein
MALTLLPVFIDAGQSLSAGVDCSAGKLVRITMPGAWDEAALTFELSSDNVFYNPWYRFDGDDMSVVVVPGAAVLAQVWEGIAWIKLRSGTHKRPINQSAQREFSLAVLTP